MSFLADLHIHSRFSRATSKALNAPHLAAWAVCKGLQVVGTGDFTHPAWRQELREQLVFDEESGLYRLRGAPEPLPLLGEAPIPPERLPYFVPQVEISSIYKRHGKVRKVHNIIFVPTLEDADRLAERLGAIGNLNADGRPILGLDSHDLLELLLETVPGGVLIPAHIWTPWFSLFGSRSGFDSVAECFGDLSDHIFAMETGLSSDPEMNRLVSQLDGYALVSNSDAHSGANLAREANVFEGKPSYEGMFAALRCAARREQPGGDCRFVGTLEFFPDEGKYHLDGHRNCNVCLTPSESLQHGNVCPVCGKPLTIGVLHRVMALADRQEPARLDREPEARSLIPLPEIVGELLACGVNSQKVQQRYASLLHALGPELDILCELPLDDIGRHWDALGEAIARLRRGQVIRNGGYDGEFGTIRLFEDGELPGRRTRTLVAKDVPSGPNAIEKKRGKTSPGIAELPLFAELARDGGAVEPNTTAPAKPSGVTYSAEQQAAMTDGPHPVLVLAGPGAGKTRLLIGRLVWLLEQGIDPKSIVALTFTQRAAGEMRERLAASLPGMAELPACQTLHAFAFACLRAEHPDAMLLSDDQAMALFAQANPGLSRREVRNAFAAMQLAEERLSSPSDAALVAQIQRYRNLKMTSFGGACLDFCDLLLWLMTHVGSMSVRPAHVLIDEIQDLTPLQLAVVRALLPDDGTGFFGIGDPDQSIYSFRGAQGLTPDALAAHWPGLAVHRMQTSYRAAQAVLDMGHSLLGAASHCGKLTASGRLATELHIFAAPSAQAECQWIARRMTSLLGATSHTLLDAGPSSHGRGSQLDGELSPGDIAVLVRLKSQIAPIATQLSQAGIPVSTPQTLLFWKDATCATLLDLCIAALRLPLPQFSQREGAVIDAEACLPESWRTSLPTPQDMKEWLDAQTWAGPLASRSEAFASLCKLWNEQKNWPDFFAQLSLLRDTDMVQSKAEVVQLMTLHAAKGLEFRAVFLPGLEDGLLPLRRQLLFGDAERETTDEAEERRLLYVGLTRASQGIFASHAASRTLFGKRLSLAPSPFLPCIREFCHQSTLVRREQKTLEQGSLL